MLKLPQSKKVRLKRKQAYEAYEAYEISPFARAQARLLA